VPAGGLLAAVAAGVIALAAPAPGHAFSLTASPAAEHIAAGRWHDEQFTIADTGTAPARVTVRIMTVASRAGACGVTSQRQPEGVTVSPARFDLKAGQRGVAHVTIEKTAPAQDLAVVFTSAGGSTGEARVSGAVASQLVIGTAPECGAPVRAAAGASHGLGNLALPLGVAGAALVAIVGSLWFSLRRRPRYGGHSRRRGGIPHGRHS